MSVREKEQVLTLTIHLKLRIVFQYMEKEGGHIVGTTQRSAGVAALHCMNHPYNITPDLAGCLFQILYT